MSRPTLGATRFALRSPLLPFQALVDWGRDLETWVDGDPRARELAIERLRHLVRRPEVREAILTASPSLDEALSAWLDDPSSPRGAHVVPTVTRYVARMASRATPFGLFSSVSVGSFGSATDLRLGGASALSRHTRIDMLHLTRLVAELERDERLRAELSYQPSAGLSRLGATYHHAEAEGLAPRIYRLVSLDASEALEAALARARGGASRADIARAVVERLPDADEASAVAFVDELIDTQVLVSELAPPITGPEPTRHLLEVLGRRAAGAECAKVLARVTEGLDALDRGGLGQASSAYEPIVEALSRLPADVDRARVFQVDLVRRCPSLALPRSFHDEVVAALDVVRRLRIPPTPKPLDAFRKAFEERYERREVRLVEALDDEHGIGFGEPARVPSPLLEGLDLGKPRTGEVPQSARTPFLARRLAALAARGEHVWDLDGADLAALAAPEPAPVPDSLAVLVTVAARSAEAIDRGDYRMILSLSGAGGANTLGRFCHADPEIRAAVEEHLRAEERARPDAVLAEIVHLPEGRVGNILCRPVLREYEIPYLGRSGVEEERRIDVGDLWVSIRRGRVCLRSERLGRWVEPRMTNAHNAQRYSLSIYRFLAAIQEQDFEGPLGWEWGPLGTLPRLPRVTCGRLVLAPAQWFLDREVLAELRRGTPAERMRALRGVRERVGLPRWVLFYEGTDHILALDLDNPLFCETFFDLVKKRDNALLVEMFPPPDELAAESDEGPHTFEVLIPFASAEAREAHPLPRPPALSRRVFPPSSEWLYAKIYGGAATADALLTQAIAPVVSAALGSGAATGWFFIRYADPDPHLRVRWRGDPARLVGSTLPALEKSLAPWLESGAVRRWGIDTYEREVERYGGPAGIELAEAVFMADSDAALEVMRDLDDGAAEDVRWRVTLLGLDRLLGLLQLDLPFRAALMQEIRDAFAAEHRLDVDGERSLGLRFRAERRAIEDLLDGPIDPRGPLARGARAIAARDERVASPMRGYLDLDRRGELGVPLGELASSLLHMHCNRMLASDHRAHELVLYDFLSRHYASKLARARKSAFAAGPPASSRGV
jgi:thiopeptide-type bacteriocin biosynthesis protein